MEPITLGIGLALSVFGTIGGVNAAKEKQRGQEMAIAAQSKAEKLREQSMVIDSARRRREMIRQAMIAKSQALTTATSQGASKGSGLQGAFGQISGGLAFGLEGVNQQEGIGHGLFAAQQELLQAQKVMASAETDSATYKGISSIGGTLISNIGPIGNLFNTYAKK